MYVQLKVGSGSGRGYEESDLDPERHQNDADPQHWVKRDGTSIRRKWWFYLSGAVTQAILSHQTSSTFPATSLWLDPTAAAVLTHNCENRACEAAQKTTKKAFRDCVTYEYKNRQCSGFTSGSGPYVFRPPGSASGSVIYFYGSSPGSGSFHQQAKKMKKNLDFYCFETFFYNFLSLKNELSESSKRNEHKNLREKKIIFCWHLEGHWRKEQDPDPHQLVEGTDPRIRIRDPYQNVTDPEHWK